jgi:hypothetical protein
VRPAARFIITSPVLEWNPNVQDISDNVWSEFNTRTIRYLGDTTQHLFWQAQDATVPNYNQNLGYVVDGDGDTGPNDQLQPEVFSLDPQYSPFGDTGFVTIDFSPVGQDEEDDWLDNDDRWLQDRDQEDDLGIGDIA